MPGRIVLKSKPSKYRNVKCVYDGQSFDSKKERDRYIVLKAMEAAGKIHNLHHDRDICTIGVKGADSEIVCKYIADFRFIEIGDDGSVSVVYEDVKSPATRRKEVYRLKKKLLAAQGITIRET